MIRLGPATLIALALTTTTAAAIPPTETARILAGMNQDEGALGPDKAGVLAGYTKKTSELWAKWDKQIGAPMRAWAATELPRAAGETIFYPFAGPDFPTVQVLYPDANRYVLVALQTGGPVPDFAAMETKALNRYLKTFRSGWESFTLRGFYDTDDLKRDTPVLDGITPALLAFAVRLGYVVDKVEPIRVDAAGKDVEVHPGDRATLATWDSVRLTLTRPASASAPAATVLLDYLYVDLSDGALAKRAHEKAWIAAMSRHKVVTKAASHLMQKPFFSIVRDAILEHTPLIWQDETGIDYADLDKRFEVRLYGKFTAANKLFMKGVQRSLARAYKTRQDIGPLPFKVGYKKESGSCVQVARRR
ncbi:MAG: hypothetical protein IT385_23760 [Deltaproteobacteria bacterium]|nr:hypothetical protein [Deltaproteobacteria bacterium]